MRGREGNLFGLSMEILWISVQGHLANFLERVVSVWPHLCNVVNVESVFGCICKWHDLNVQSPRWEVAILDSIEQVHSCVILGFHAHFCCLLVSEVLDSLICLEVVLNKECFTGSIDPLEGVGTVAVHVSVSIGSSTIRHKDGDLMEGLWRIRPEVPGHLSGLNTSLWVSLLAVDEIWELDWILDEENWSVVSDDIVVAFFCVELDSEASWISLTIIGTTFSSDSGEAEEKRGLLADLAQEVCLRPSIKKSGYVMSLRKYLC